MDVPWQTAFTHEVTLSAGDTIAQIAPGRGGLVTDFSVGGRPILFLDRATLIDPAANVRGGIPLLFPNAGKLADDRLIATGTTLRQHGYARRFPWEITDQQADRLTMRLITNPAIVAQYPFPCTLEATVQVAPQRLRITLQITNTGTTPMPVASGWHPYFALPHDEKTNLASQMLGDAVRRFSDEHEFDFHVPRTGPCDLIFPDGRSIRLDASPEHQVLQLWSLPGRDFICAEPFIGPPDALNKPDQALSIAPGSTREVWMEIAVQ